ncbi:MAG: DoxX family membrane protein [Saprospiraceae bacterium]|nr:DoxX family membrane protein [Saprospiraceae bacterium]
MEITTLMVMRVLFSAFMAILFIQSGLDKVFNWNDEKSFYKKHFSQTFLRGTIDLLMPTITLAELAAGFLSAIGILSYLFMGDKTLACIGMLMANIALLMLFFGQRVAKNYSGAATLVTYFLVAAAGLYFYWQ